MKLIFRIREHLQPEWWMGRCYFDPTRNEGVMAPLGLHLVIRAWWWCCLRFWRWQFGPCYLDNTIRGLMEIREENSKLKRQLQWVNYENTLLRSEVLSLKKTSNPHNPNS